MTQSVNLDKLPATWATVDSPGTLVTHQVFSGASSKIKVVSSDV